MRPDNPEIYGPRARARRVALRRQQESAARADARRELNEFREWSAEKVSELFDEAMQRFNMPATVVADELFTCLVGSSRVRKVDTRALEERELAKAVRRRIRENPE